MHRPVLPKCIKPLPILLRAHQVLHRSAVSPECHPRDPSRPSTTCLRTLTAVPRLSEQHVLLLQYLQVASIIRRTLHKLQPFFATTAAGLRFQSFLHNRERRPQPSLVLETVSSDHCSGVQRQPSQHCASTAVSSTGTAPVFPISAVRVISRHL